MNRLQKKCFIASAGLHSLLVLILLVGPAFLSSKGRPDDMQVLDVIPSKLVDAAFSGGGNPKAAPPPPAPPAPPQPVAKPAPQPEKQREPDPPQIKPKVDPDSLEASKEPKPKKYDLELKPIKRPVATRSKPAKDHSSDAPEKKAAEKQRQIAELIGSATRSLRSDLSTTTTIDSDYGPGGGGPAYANYALAVKSIYEHAWMPPDDTKSDDAITKVTVTIRKDGTVASSRIIRASGDKSVDASVQRTLDRVSFVAPFPEGAKESERTYTINFNLKAKRLVG